VFSKGENRGPPAASWDATAARGVGIVTAGSLSNE